MRLYSIIFFAPYGMLCVSRRFHSYFTVGTHHARLCLGAFGACSEKRKNTGYVYKVSSEAPWAPGVNISENMYP